MNENFVQRQIRQARDAIEKRPDWLKPLCVLEGRRRQVCPVPPGSAWPVTTETASE